MNKFEIFVIGAAVLIMLFFVVASTVLPFIKLEKIAEDNDE